MTGAHSISFISVSSILILLLLQTHTGSLAPTHHLRIGVQGNTPTLIVTSSEVGITPKSLEKYDKHTSKDTMTTFTTTTTASTTTIVPPKWLHKSNQIKSKNKSQKSSLYEKKREKLIKEKSTIFHEKSSMPTAILSTRPSSTSLPSQHEVTTKQIANVELTSNLQKSSAAKVTKKPILETSTIKTQKVGIETTERNEFALKTKTEEASTTTTLSTITTTALKGSTSPSSTLQKKEIELSSTIAPSATTLGSLPYQKHSKTSTTSSSVIEDATETTVTTLTTTMKPLDTTMTTTNSVDTVLGNIVTTTSSTANTASTINITNNNINDKMKALPTAISTELSKKIEKSESLMKMSSTIVVESSTTTETPVITTEVTKHLTSKILENLNSKTPTTTTEPYKVIKIENDNEKVEITSQEPSTTLITTEAVEVTTIAKLNATEIMSTTQATTKSPSTDNEEVKHNTTADATAIKLIDLEKHIPISMDELRTKNIQSQINEDGGHDGIKQTKKKQLPYKHFMTDTIDFVDIQTTATTTSPSTSKPIEMNGVITTEQHNIEKPTLITPTLTPNHNSFLGPVVMEEHTFSVKNPTKPHEHELSIESKLHDGRIVEIIAPTALLEQQETTTTTMKNMNQQQKIPITKKPRMNTNTQQQEQQQQQEATVFSTTVFQVQDMISSTTRKPHAIEQLKDEKQASKISDIQIEVYDSVMAAPTGLNFDNQRKSLVGSTKPPPVYPTTQERFTQYVVDRTESSTPDTTVLNGNLKFLGIGKPEPAAIEIHINVSEGITNQSEDLEFSYQQTENTDESVNSNLLTTKPLVVAPLLQSESINNERGDDILIVEIIDTGENSTEIQSPEKPVFTIRTDTNSNIELKDVKFEGNNDELFLADAKPPIQPPPPPPRGSNTDRDSDTIFYISNTEVKVGESPTTKGRGGGGDDTRQAQMRRTKLENQFFPANYVASTHPNTASAAGHNHNNQQQTQQKHLYEEDIILSPIRNTADSLKIFRSQGDGAPPLDVTYVGESVIEVEQSSGAGIGGGITTTSATASATMLSQAPDVIIQPAILPEMSIGVPVIGELPPQIELKEIDFMPNEANQQHSGENNDIEENLSASNNDLDRLVESSIQYGGDLIDEGAADSGAGFDGVEGSYPFGNMAAMRRKGTHKSAADYAHFQLHHSVNNLRKDELSVDVDVESATKETNTDGSSENSTIAMLDGVVAGIAALHSDNNNNNNSTKETLVNATRTEVVQVKKNTTANISLPKKITMKDLETTNLTTLIVTIILIILMIVCAAGAYYLSKDMNFKWNEEFTPSTADNLPNGEAIVCQSGESGSSPKNESTNRQFTSNPANSDSFELTSTTNVGIANCLPVPDANSTVKPSNFNNNNNNNCNSNSLNIVNEKEIVDNLVNRSREAEAQDFSTSKIMQFNSNVCPTNSVPDSSYAGPNGSVTKMTLKNNHLIVETEERNDISRNARETKMHYNASEKDGVFVVEVARGIDSNLVTESIVNDATTELQTVTSNDALSKSPARKFEDEPAVLNSHEQVQIHQPPTEIHKSNTERSLHQIDEAEEETILSPKPENKTETNVKIDFNKNSNTGLSQSDLSSTSSNDSNKRYSYGNQELYTIEQVDCTTRSPKVMTPNIDEAKDINETKDDDRKSENGKGFEHTPEKTSNSSNNNNNNNEGFNEVKENEEIIDNDTSAKNSDDKKAQKIMEKKEVEVNAKDTVDVEVIEQPQQQDNEEIIKPVEALKVENIIEVDNAPQSMEVDIEPLENEVVVDGDDDDADDDDEAVSEVELVTTETDTTQKLNIEKVELSSNGLPLEVQLDADTDPEFAYDSLMSLPDPPSNEEMTNFSDFNGIEINQLDSLPPPPPALLADENINMPDIVAEIKSKTLISCPQPIAVINGNIEHELNGHVYQNGHQQQQQQQISDHNASSQLPPPLLEEVNSNSKIMPSSPLTPPESPPSTPPYSNGVLGINERVCAPVAVDVNVS